MKRDGYRIFAILTALVLLTGCQGGKYKKIPVTGEAETGLEAESESSFRVKAERRFETEPESGKLEIVIEDAEGSGQKEEMISDFSDEDKENGSDHRQEGAGSRLNEDKRTLLFSGDVLLSNHVLNAYDNAGGIHGVLDEAYREQIEKADFFLVNQEFPFSDRGTAAEDKQYTFRLSPERVSLFQEMGIDGVTLANNHALDFGREALLDSCEVLDRAGILHTGAGTDLETARKPVTMEFKGKRIAVIGATRVIPVADWAAGKQHPGMLAAYDMTVLLEEIRAQKQKNDFVAVCIHWGIERDERPQDYQRTMGRQMIDAGADLVIGSHPHVLQGIEYYKGKAIVYSLGNFVFGSSIPRTALLQVTWEQETDRGQMSGAYAEEIRDEPVLRLLPGTSSAGYTRMMICQKDVKPSDFFRHP